MPADAAPVSELLGSYQQALDMADGDLPFRHRRFRRLWLPFPLLLRVFLESHMRARLKALKRRYSARAAIGVAEGSEEDDRRAVDDFLASLPPVQYRRLGIGIAVWVYVLSFALQVLVRFVFLVRLDMSVLTNSAAAVVTLDGKGIVEAVRQSASGHLANAIWVVGVVVVALLLVLLPMTIWFGVKRTLFNLRPSKDAALRLKTIRQQAGTADGIYDMEARLFRRVGAKWPREFAFDLLIVAIPVVFGLLFAAAFLYVFVEQQTRVSGPDFVRAFGIIMAPAMSLFVRVARSWRLRRQAFKCLAQGEGPLTPKEPLRERMAIKGPHFNWISLARAVVTLSLFSVIIVFLSTSRISWWTFLPGFVVALVLAVQFGRGDAVSDS